MEIREHRFTERVISDLPARCAGRLKVNPSKHNKPEVMTWCGRGGWTMSESKGPNWVRDVSPEWKPAFLNGNDHVYSQPDHCGIDCAVLWHGPSSALADSQAISNRGLEEDMKTIFALDDNPDDLLLLKYALLQGLEEHRLMTATDGVDAEAILERARDGENPVFPAVIFLDVHMPRRSGLQFLKWLKGESGLQRIPVVMLSGSDNPAELDTALQLGAVACLRKPPNPYEIMGVLKTIEASSRSASLANRGSGP
jgi:chemotaxis family two-component system response regulator Rcp1